MLQTLSSLLLSAAAFVTVLSVVVFVHEFGHFQVSRWFKIQIKSFSIGFGAPLFEARDKHGTTWKISQIPIGGFVSYVGDADATSVRAAEPIGDAAALAEARRAGLYQAQPPVVRALTAFAGPGANFVFAIA